MFNLTIPEIFTLIGAMFVFVLGIMVFSENKKNVINILFFLVSLVFTIWMFGTFMMFLSEGNEEKIMFWDRFIYLGVVFMPAFQYHFSLKFTKENKKRRILLFISYFLSLCFLLISRTDYFLKGAFYYKWGSHSIAQVMHHFFMLFFFFYIFALLYNFLKKYFESSDDKTRKSILFLVLNFSILNLLGGLGYLPAYKISIYPIFLWAPAIFSILMMLAIGRYQLLNVKLIAAQVFSLAIALIALVNIFLADNFSEFIVKVTFFVFIAIMVIFFSRSVAKEVKRKEELQLMANELSSANDQLRKLDNAKSEFISIASHQLRTPLTAIKGFVSLLLEGSYGKISKEVKETLNKVYSSNERLIDLVESLLNLSRIESGRMEYKFEKNKLDDICKEVYDTFAIRAKEKNMNFELILPKTPLPEVSTDGSKVREVISNLVDNALKYTIKGGVKIKLSDEGESVRVAIIDTGIGIPKEELPYLFSKFSRGKDINRLNAGGTGLGLHVGKRMIDELHGKIWIESAGANLGSTFFVDIPKEYVEKK